MTWNRPVRTHDAFYLTEPTGTPKESFIRVADLIEEWATRRGVEIFNIADWGCAVAAFPDYLSKRFSSSSVVGYEVRPDLVSEAGERYPMLDVRVASVLDSRACAAAEFDVIVAMGLLSIFDDPQIILSNFKRWTKPGGCFIIHGLFNPEDVDVLIRYRRANSSTSDPWETGWNIISQKTIGQLLAAEGLTNHRFVRFHMPFDLERHTDDPLRSWTITVADGSREVTNGLSILQPQMFLQVFV